MPDHCDSQLIKSRSKRMRELADSLWEEYSKSFYTLCMDVLWESEKDGRWIGKTSNYLPVISPLNSPGLSAGAITPARIIGLYGCRQLLVSPVNPV